ncbi:hypothetical protein [Nonomuraea sp. KM90]
MRHISLKLFEAGLLATAPFVSRFHDRSGAVLTSARARRRATC